MAIVEKVDEYLELNIDDLVGRDWQSFKLFQPSESIRCLTPTPFCAENYRDKKITGLSFHDQELLLRFTALHPHSQQWFVWKIVELLEQRNKNEMRLTVPWSERRTRVIRIRLQSNSQLIGLDFQLML